MSEVFYVYGQFDGEPMLMFFPTVDDAHEFLSKTRDGHDGRGRNLRMMTVRSISYDEIEIVDDVDVSSPAEIMHRRALDSDFLVGHCDDCGEKYLLGSDDHDGERGLCWPCSEARDDCHPYGIVRPI